MNQLFEEPEAEIRVAPRPELETPVPTNIGTIEEHVKTILKWRLPTVVRWLLPRKVRERREEAVASAIAGLESCGKEGVIALGKLMLQCNEEIRKRIAPILMKSDESEVLEALHCFVVSQLRRIRNRKIMACLFLCAYLSQLFPLIFHLPIPEYLEHLFNLMLPSSPIVIIIVLTFFGQSTITPDSVILLQHLSKEHDIQYLSLFLRCARSPHPYVKKVALEGITATLKGVRSGDRYKISATMQKALVDMIDIWKPKLTLSILKALEKAGDEKAIPRVEKLIAELPGRKYFMLRKLSLRRSELDDEAMQEAAENCVAILKNRAVETSESQTLLRASSVPVQAETLLRPAQSSGEDKHPEELLRPH